MNIDKKDVIWSIISTVFKLSANIILLPFIVVKLTTEDIGIWTVLTSIASLSYLFDFGFSDSFARNITYIYSGATKLQRQGYQVIQTEKPINYELLKETISAMKKFYRIISLIVLLLLNSIGLFYLHNLIHNYHGNSLTLIIVWISYSVLIFYQLYTLYYESLLRGRGLIKIQKQILLVSTILFIGTTSILLACNLGLFSILIGQLLSVILNRFLSYKAFYDNEIKLQLSNAAKYKSDIDLIKVIAPNSIKLGITGLGGYLITKSSIIIGSLFLPLSTLAAFGISKQLIDILFTFSTTLMNTYLPKISKHRVLNQVENIKRIVINNYYFILICYLAGSILVIFCGDFALGVLGSKLRLISSLALTLALFSSFIESYYTTSGSVLLTKNTVPFFYASIISGASIVVLMFIFAAYFKLGIYALVIAPLLVNIVYQGWKWPLEVTRDLNIKFKDFIYNRQ